MKSYHKNPRQITEKQFGNLKTWLDEFGDLSGIVHDLNSDEIIGGNMRSKAFGIEGKDVHSLLEGGRIVITESFEHPTRTGTVALGKIVWNGESYNYRQVRWTAEKCERANLIANNAGGAWDWDMLSSFSPEVLQSSGFDHDLLMNYSNDFRALGEFIDSQKPEPKDAEPQIDRAEELQKKWQVQTGDLWQIGEHRLICGDCTDAEVVKRVMQGEKADCVFTDPPYGMDLDADFSDMKGIGQGNKYPNVEGDDFDYDPSHIFKDFGYCQEIFLWGADYYAERIPNRNDGSWFVWDKTEGGVSPNTAYDKMFGSNFELCWSKAKHKRALARVLWKGIFGLNKEPERKRYHPTQKPVELYSWFIEKFTKENKIVVDLFAGAGGNLIACENLHRRCRAVEISPAYCAVTLERMAQAFPELPIQRIEPSEDILGRENGR